MEPLVVIGAVVVIAMCLYSLRVDGEPDGDE